MVYAADLKSATGRCAGSTPARGTKILLSMPEQLFQIRVKALARNEDGNILMLQIPQMEDRKSHWDLPGGRMDESEDLLDTLKRELIKEIGLSYVGKPVQLAALKTNITIPVGNIRVPLLFVVYEIALGSGQVVLDPESNKTAYQWFSPQEAANEMQYKLPAEFCELVRQRYVK